MGRDNFDLATKEVLAKRVGWRCSNPNCRKLTSGPQVDGNKCINIGVAAHISAASPGGSRYDNNLSADERKSIENGIWLCQNCAKLIDNDSNQYSVDLIKSWKRLSEQAALLEIQTNEPPATSNLDVEMIRFYAQCLDRPAFQDYFQQEGSMEDFDKALEDTITAFNTGVLRSRDGAVLQKSKGKSYLTNQQWRNKMDVIVDLLRAMRERYILALAKGEIHAGTESMGRNFYCIHDRSLADWFDSTRYEILKIFSEISSEIGIPRFSFPRPRKHW